MSEARKTAKPKVTIIASKGANQAINFMLEDRDELSSTIPAAILFKIWARWSI